VSEPLFYNDRKCKICGNVFSVLHPDRWAYKRGNKGHYEYFCSWRCLRAYDKANEREEEERKMGNISLRLKPEQKAEAIQQYYKGGNKAVYAYLKSCGIVNCEKCWKNIRDRLKKQNPAEAVKLADARARIQKERILGKDEPPVVKLTGPIKIETPEGNQVHVVEVPEDPQPVSKPLQPLMFDGYTVRCIEGKYGRFFWDYNCNRLDWTSPEGEEVSMSPQGWTAFCTEVMPKVMAILGVNP
jgi:hypothetical protein